MISYTSFSFFLLYFGITFVIYSLVPQKAKWVVALCGSYVFYFISGKGHILQIIASTLIIWGIGLWLQKLNDTQKAKKKGLSRDEKKALKKRYNKYKQAVLALGVIGTMGILMVSKYSNFFIDTTNALFSTDIKNVKFIQPLGISFYTLQAVSYITDIHRGKYKAEKNPFRVALYLSFILTIVEGPVARYDQLGVQLQQGGRLEPRNIVSGAQRVLWGLFKKIVVADRAAMLVAAVFDNGDGVTGFPVVMAILFYTLQLYLEFSGIIDVMCGLGEMMGITMPENFNRPFFAKTINEFWQRWHITLGSWLRDYIFYPISLSKPFMSLSKSARKKFDAYYSNLIPTAVALFFVWFGNGFWHGSGWKYITYGLYYYVLMMLGLFLEPLFRKICSSLKIDRKSTPFQVFQVIRTFIIVNLGMLIFRADSLTRAKDMLKAIFTAGGKPFSFTSTIVGLSYKDYAVIAVGTAIVLGVSIAQEKGVNIRERIARLPYAAKFVLFMLAAFAVIIFGAYGEGYGVVDLIYANF